MNEIRFVFLDRDGVINRKLPEGQYVGHPGQFHLLDGSAEAIAVLNRRQCTVLVVTNQRGIALGRYSERDLNALHDYLRGQLALYGAHIDAFYFCPHDRNQCGCRKPKLGLFLQAAADFPGITPENSVIVGDSLHDIEAGHAFGMRAYFVRGDPESRKAGAEKAEETADGSFDSLKQAVASLF